jgi:cytochrome c-type biogenesis protein CcmF
VAAPLGIGLGAFLILSAINEIASRAYAPGRSPGAVARRALGLPRSAWGSALAHAGVGVTAIGIAASAWSVETVASVKPGGVISAGPYEVRLLGAVSRPGPNYREDAVKLVVMSGGVEIGPLETTKRLYTARAMTTTEAGIMTLGLSQVYVSVGEVYPDGGIGLRLFHKPLVLAIWLGAVVMAAGAALSLTDRRYRVGAPVRATMAAHPAPAE